MAETPHNHAGLPAGVVEELQTQIAELERTLRQVRDHNALLHAFYSLVENAPDAIVVTDLTGTVTYANPAFKHLYGYGDASVGMAIPRFFPATEAPQLGAMMEELQAHGVWRGTITNRRQDGSLFTSQESALVIVDQSGTPQAMAAIVRDITAVQEAEQERMRLQEQVIAVQQATLTELSTPLIPITDTIVALPLIGSIDTRRAQQILEALLQGVAATRAQIVILDITGVPLVDTQVANTLIHAAQAVKLLGAQVIITGIRPEVAQTLVGLGTGLADILTLSSLQAGIAYATGGKG